MPPATPFEQANVPLPEIKQMATNFTTTQDKLESLYIGYFGRAGDPAGVTYWTGALNSGAMSDRQTAYVSPFNSWPNTSSRA